MKKIDGLFESRNRIDTPVVSIDELFPPKSEDPLISFLSLENKWREVFDTITDAVTIHDENYNIVQANQAARTLLGLPSDLRSSNKKCFHYYHGTDAPPAGCKSCKCLNGGDAVTFEADEPHLAKHVEIRAIPQTDKTGRTTGLVHILRDVTDRKRAEVELQHHREQLEQMVELRTQKLREALQKLEEVARTDHLTGAYNRHWFFETLRQEINRAERHGRPMSIILLDIDHFKQVNDEHGHGVGDDVLRGVVKTLRGEMRNIDSLTRWGGEEFVIIAPETAPDEAASLAERLRTSVEKTEISGCKITISLGLSAHTVGDDTEELIRRADAALYRAKARGRNRVEAERG